MDIHVYNQDLEWIGIIDTYNTLIWNRKYYDCGDFELHLPLNTNNLKLLSKGNILCKADNLKEGAYIDYRDLEETENGEEKLIVKGKLLKGYLGKRIIWNTTKLYDTAENCMRKLVVENCINPSIHNRKIEKLFLGNLKGFKDHINYQISYSNLLEEINKICSMTGLSTSVILDIKNKQMTFDIWKGLDRTINQNVNPWAIFSQDFDNVLQQKYVDSVNNYNNTALVGGQIKEDNRVFEIIGNNNKGLDRNEMFVDARDINDNGNLVDRGLKKLDEHKKITTFDSIINTYANLIYTKDYDLGDQVTFKSEKWDIALNTRITEIQEVYDENGFNINCIFGNSIPTLIDIINNIKNN